MKDKQSFVNLSIQTVVLLGTIFLQYVSFATTYRGISFYFQEMAPPPGIVPEGSKMWSGPVSPP